MSDGWRSACTSATNCVEVAFRSASGCADRQCVEVSMGDEILVRDSKHPEVAPMAFTREEWNAFLAGVRAGEFN